MTATLKKLRYKKGMRVGVVGAPSAFEAELAAVDGITRAQRLSKLDLVQGFYTRLAHLERDVPRLKASLVPRGILWICYPKAKALGTDLNRDIVRASVRREGLEAVAICSIDEVWSALRCKLEG